MFQKAPNVSLSQIAESILKLSDFYIQVPGGSTPWSKEFCKTAYRHYFLPLNYLRCQRVVEKGAQVGFFDDLTHFIDWGCGPGTASLAIAHSAKLQKNIKKQVLIDQSPIPLEIFSDRQAELIHPEKTSDTSLKSHLDQKHQSCLIFSYSLTEIEELPRGWDQFEALMILEPSTGEDGRKLLGLRQQLLEKGYSMWAPCTHQLRCPLLIESKSDWCHDRIVVNAPQWFEELEQLLPMKNRTITTSYLLARKRKSPDYPKNMGRLIGDSREENGKTRQLFCRGEKREFLAWMHKKITPQVFPRGELAQLPELVEEKSNELRVQSECELVVDPASQGRLNI